MLCGPKHYNKEHICIQYRPKRSSRIITVISRGRYNVILKQPKKTCLNCTTTGYNGTHVIVSCQSTFRGPEYKRRWLELRATQHQNLTFTQRNNDVHSWPIGWSDPSIKGPAYPIVVGRFFISFFEDRTATCTCSFLSTPASEVCREEFIETSALKLSTLRESRETTCALNNLSLSH